MGLIKFVFPNHYDVYLRGTSEQKLLKLERALNIIHRHLVAAVVPIDL